jgi:hypothetical protein
MKEWLKWTGLVLLAAIVGLAFAIVFTARRQAQVPFAVAQSIVNQANLSPVIVTSTARSVLGQEVIDPATPYPRSWGYGWGGGYGPVRMGHGMMGGYRGWADSSSSTLLTLDEAIEAANLYLAAYGNSDLTITEVMEFAENFYAEVEEKSSGIHAFEILIDRYTGAVYPEPGPNMMWNTRYGHMGGMMGSGSWQAGSASVTAEQALDFAQQWLDQNLPGTSVAEKADAFYGYYTIHVMKDGQVYGMLSLNDYTGEVWYHTWHGNFVEMKELEE